jgi:hypothetical protein
MKHWLLIVMVLLGAAAVSAADFDLDVDED